MFRNYLKVAFRNIFKNKIFAVINIVGLALGITCGLGIFMIVSYETSFDTFHPNSKNIYRVVSDFHYPEGNQYQSGTPFPLPGALKVDLPQIQYIATSFGGANNQLDVIDGGTKNASKRFLLKTGVFYLNPGFFKVFDFKWLVGDPARILATPNQIVLTRSLAEQYFGKWQDAIGKTIRKDNSDLLQVAGILENPPKNSDFQFQAVISYITLLNGPFAKPLLADWGTVSSTAQCFIALRSKKDALAVSTQLQVLRTKYFGSDDKTDYFSLQPLHDLHFNKTYGSYNYTMTKSTLWSLSLIGLFLLGLACVNFINLATAQAAKRSREVGIRKVMGSKRYQLGLQFLGETFIIVLVSALLSLALLNMLEPFAGKLLARPVSINPLNSPEALQFTVIVIALVTLLSGFYPAIIISGYKPIQALKNNIKVVSAGGFSLRRVLVVFQFTIAQGLIIATLVVISQVHFYAGADLGFNKEAIVTVSIPADSTSRGRWDAFVLQLKQQGAIENVSLSYSSPASQNAHTTNFRFNQNTKDEAFELNVKPADVSYFDTYRLKLVAGNYYQAADTARDIIVNETFVKKEGLLNPAEAVGKYIMIDGKKLVIAGVVNDFHQTSLRAPIAPIALMPQKKNYRIASIKLQAGKIPEGVKIIQQQYGQFFPDDLFQYNFLDETIENFYKQEKHLADLFKLFSGIGIFISCIGLYGLVLFMTVQRIKEVGLRKVLGASEINIVMLFFREFMVLIGIAFVIAAALTWYGMQEWLNNFAYHTSLSWRMFLMVGIASLVLSMLTVSWQTVKAAMANPVKSLRME